MHHKCDEEEKMTSKNFKSKKGSSKENKKMTKAESVIQNGLKIYGPIDIKVDDIDLDDRNMRFAAQYSKKLKQAEIKEVLDENFDIKVLQKQIVKHGQVYMPIHVIRKGSRFLVKDGSRRLRSMQRILVDYKN